MYSSFIKHTSFTMIKQWTVDSNLDTCKHSNET